MLTCNQCCLFGWLAVDEMRVEWEERGEYLLGKLKCLAKRNFFSILTHPSKGNGWSKCQAVT